jgi:hypothetical protein
MVTVDDCCELNVESSTNEGILAQEHLLLLSTTTSTFVLLNFSLPSSDPIQQLNGIIVHQHPPNQQHLPFML